MTTVDTTPARDKQPTAADLQRSFLRHLQYTLVKDKFSATKADLYQALAYAVRDVLVDRWLDAQQSYYINDAKRVYYMSMEFLMGRTLGNSLINLGIMEEWQTALKQMGIDVEELQEQEWDAGLGNDMIGNGSFSPHDQNLFKPIVDTLLGLDHYLLLADYSSYIACQDEVDTLYQRPDEWARTSILNTASMGKFSSDRTISEYASEIWNIKPEKISRHSRRDLQ
jgi:glucan phosphorylase